MAEKRIRLTDEEKVIKEYYQILVNKRVSEKDCNNIIEKFCQDYVNAVKKGTRFEQEKIGIYEEKRPKCMGSMSTERNGKLSPLTVKFSIFNKYFTKRDEGQRFYIFTELLDTLNHEMQHYIDNKEVENYIFSTKGMSLNKCMEVVSEKLAQIADKYNFYSVEEGNYENVIMEGDARRTGAIKSSTQLLRIAPKMPGNYKKFLAKKVEKSMKEDNIDFENLKFDNSKEKYDRYDVTSAYVDEIIAANPGMLTRAPYDIMTYEYNSDGTRKTFDELVHQRNEIYENVKSNKKINEDTRSALYLQLNTAFSRIMYNSLRRATPESIIDLRRRLGDKTFLNELYYIRQGKINSVKEKLEKFDQHIDFFNDHKELLDKSFAKEVGEEYKNFYEKSGYKVYVGKNKEEYESLESDSMVYLTKLKDNVSETYNKYPMYTREERFEKNEIRKVKRAESKKILKQDYLDRQVVIKQKEEAERQKQEEERRRKAQAQMEALKRKLKNPLYRFVYNIKNGFNKNKALEAASAESGNSKLAAEGTSYKYNLGEKREMVANMQSQKQELEDRFNSIVDESKETLLEAEAKINEDKAKNIVIKEREEDKKKVIREDRTYGQENR